jgi:NADPH2:quinone reductase
MRAVAVDDHRSAPVVAELRTARGIALALVNAVEPLHGRTVLIVGADGAIGSFATQFAAKAGARVIANVRGAAAAERLRGYGAAGTLDDTVASMPNALRLAYPEGIDVLIDLASDAKAFAKLAWLVKPDGTALTTRCVADVEALAATGVTGINFALQESSVPGAVSAVV